MTYRNVLTELTGWLSLVIYTFFAAWGFIDIIFRFGIPTIIQNWSITMGGGIP